MTVALAVDRFPAAARRYLGTKLAHILHRLGGALGGCDAIDERGSHDHAVGKRRYEGSVGGRRDAKTDRERFFRQRSQARYLTANYFPNLTVSSRDAHAAYDIDEIGAQLCNRPCSDVRCCWRHEERNSKTVCAKCVKQRCCFFEREIWNDDPGQTCGGKIYCCFLDASSNYWVVVREPDERRVGQPALSEARNLQCSIKCHSSQKSAMGGALDRRSIGEGVRVRDSDLNDIGASIPSCCNNFDRRIAIWVSCHDKWDKRRFFFIATPLEDATHVTCSTQIGRHEWAPVVATSAASLTASLSPRPERLTSIRSREGSCSANLQA